MAKNKLPFDVKGELFIRFKGEFEYEIIFVRYDQIKNVSIYSFNPDEDSRHWWLLVEGKKRLHFDSKEEAADGLDSLLDYVSKCIKKYGV